MAILKNGVMRLNTGACQCPSCAASGPVAPKTRREDETPGDAPSLVDSIREEELARRTPTEIERDQRFQDYFKSPPLADDK